MFKTTDYVLLISMLILSVIGIIAIYSAGYNTEVNKDEYIKQSIWLAISIIFMVIIWLIDYNIFDIGGYILYTINLILLIVVLFMPSLMGANSWFNLGGILYQPSELMKIATIICGAKFITIYKNSINKSNKKAKLIYLSLIALNFILPISLILLQPDFGTAIAFVMIAIFMIFKSGIKYRYVIASIAIIILLIPVVYFFLLNDVQKERINVFLNPELDPLGSGYNAIQSKIAIGSGMLFGSGFLNGAQTQYGYIPIKSSDFIFSVISEELGFIMSVTIIILYTILLIRLILISNRINDEFASLMVIGITGMFFFHFVENIGMTIGLLPITGVPLPFLSYGGSSLLTNSLAIAIALNVSARYSKNSIFD